MLGFLRKHQKYFFVVITIVIVISFSFFGTYSAMQGQEIVDPVVFTSIDGTEYTRSELEEMVVFLGTDVEDKQWLNGAWGPNFLNDGVIKNDFIESGLAKVVGEAYLEALSDDLNIRHQKEKRYTPYEHPGGPFIKAENIWNYVAPQMNRQLQKLKMAEDPATPEAFNNRLELFKGQRRFPPSTLRQAIQHQEKQFNWIQPDRDLPRTNLSLFGYYTVEDWFGPRLMRLLAEYVINAAAIAEERGYEVTREEAYADLLKHAETNYRANINNPRLGVANSSEYIQEQLRRMGIDLNRAVKIWEQVLLFRRLFQDMGSSVFVDPFTIGQFQQYAKQSVQGVLYQLPEELHLGNFRDLQRFEVYLAAVGGPTDDPLDVPTTFKSVEEVAKLYPELVQRKYTLNIATVDKKSLQAKVSVKDTWNWEVEDMNWEMLKKEFPELGVAKAEIREERFAALDALDERTRGRVDAFAREKIVNNHPEWLDKALQNALTQKQEMGLREKGGKIPFEGLKDRKGVISLLDNWPESKEELAKVSGDGRHYYRIEVIERADEPEVLTFAVANEDGTLDQMLTRKLEAEYLVIRNEDPEEFRNAEGEWKPFVSVRNQVADKVYADLIEAIRQDYIANNPNEKAPEKMFGDYAASLRLTPHVRGIRERIEKDSSSEALLVRQEGQAGYEEQFKLVKSDATADRTTSDFSVKIDEVMQLQPESFSRVYSRPNGAVAFLKYMGTGESAVNEGTYQSLFRIQRVLGSDAQKELSEQLLEMMQEKNALNIDYLRRA